MSDKYIIKNCECKVKGKTTLCVRDIPYKKCENITDCKLKQIVEKCKKYIENYNDKIFYDKDDVQILMGKVMLSQSILDEFLDIQEVE